MREHRRIAVAGIEHRAGHRREANGRAFVGANLEAECARLVRFGGIAGRARIVVAGSEIVFVNHDLRSCNRARNVVLDIDRERARKNDGVAVEIFRREQRGEIERKRIGIPARRVQRQMIELIQQREGEGAVTVVVDREDRPVVGRHTSSCIGIDDVEADGRALRKDARRHTVDRAIEREGRRLIGADREERGRDSR